MKTPLLKKQIIKIFQKFGLSKDHSLISTNALINAELAGTTGIGFVENVAKKYFQYEVIWITIIIMGLLGLLFDITLRKIIDKTIPWRGKG